jgi:hypothetical protein
MSPVKRYFPRIVRHERQQPLKHRHGVRPTIWILDCHTKLDHTLPGNVAQLALMFFGAPWGQPVRGQYRRRYAKNITFLGSERANSGYWPLDTVQIYLAGTVPRIVRCK